MAAPFQSLAVSSPSVQVELSVSCKDLKNMDVMSFSDPMCVLSLCTFGKSTYQEIDRTERVKNCLNPEFVKKFLINYYFEESQKLRFTIYDSDVPTGNLLHQDYLGQLHCTLAELVSSTTLTRPLSSGKGHDKDHIGHSGFITVRAEEVGSCNDVVVFNLSASNVDKKDFLGKSDPFLVISKCNPDGSFSVVHKSEVCRNTLNPHWDGFTLPVSTLCNGDFERSLKLECFDWDGDGSHDLIGEVKTNLRELTATGKQPDGFPLINPAKKDKKKGYKNSGVINVLSCSIKKQYGFLDYITAGVQINFTVAIDFTASNGNPAHPESLHYIDNYGLNQYGNALLSVGGIIQDYDSDKQFPALGFGAKLANGVVSHEFYLNGSATSPFCSGISGVMQAYQAAIRAVTLYGPTNFAPVINHVLKFAAAIRDGSNYFVLLIITDGEISDMNQTKEAIINASSLPMSIIIIGVGGADFSAMEALDGDKYPLQHNGRRAERDIVQFVPMRDFLSAGDPAMVQATLAKAVLSEVPNQFLQYMRKHNITPPKSRALIPGLAALSVNPPVMSGPPAMNPAVMPGAPVMNPPMVPGPPAMNPAGVPGAPAVNPSGF